MRGRTIIMVSHHVQLCTPGASYIVALNNGRLQFEGDRESFQNSIVMQNLVHSTDTTDGKEEAGEASEGVVQPKELDRDTASTAIVASELFQTKVEKKQPRKLVEEEKRAVGFIGRDVWETYFKACGSGWYWALFLSIVLIASLSPVFENGWIRCVMVEILLICRVFRPCQILGQQRIGR